MGQVVEHLPPPMLLRLLELARAEAPPGRILVAETINPLSPLALRNYFADLTHAQPLVPETLALLARQAGFASVETRFLNPPPRPDGVDAEVARDPLRAARLRDRRAPSELADEVREDPACARRRCPFARGGAEILAERLTHELQGHGHEADLVTMPFKWYPGAKVLTHALLWRLADLDGGGRPADRPRDRDEVPLLRRAAPEQGRLARAPVPPGVRARRHRPRPVRRLRRGPGDATRAFTGWTASRWARRGKLGAISQNVADRVKRYTGLDAEVILPPPQQLDFRCDSYDDFVLSVNRLDRAKRIDLLLEAAATDGSMRVSSRATDPTASASSGSRTSAASTGGRPSPVACPRPSSPISMRAAAASTTRPSTRTTGWFRTRRSCRRSLS